MDDRWLWIVGSFVIAMPIGVFTVYVLQLRRMLEAERKESAEWFEKYRQCQTQGDRRLETLFDQRETIAGLMKERYELQTERHELKARLAAALKRQGELL